MVKTYFKIAWRNISRNKGFSLINICGLAIGMASAMLILLWVKNETSFDRFHANLSRLFQVWSNDKINGTIRSMTPTPEIMAPSLKKDYPEVETASRVSWTRNLLSAEEDKKFLSTGSVVDASFLKMFNFPLLKGNPSTALLDHSSIVLTETLAIKLFNTDDVVGKIVRMGNSENLTVSAVLKNLPANSQFNTNEYFLSYGQNPLDSHIDREWGDFGVSTFVLLNPNSSGVVLSRKIKNIVAEHTGGTQKTEEFLYPVSQLWLYGDFENGKPVGGRIIMVRAFSLIALFILLIACINFMNLSTAHSEKRAKEVGIRKVAGALRKTLIVQFLGESIAIALIAGLIAVIIMAISLPWFNELVGRQLEFEYRDPYFLGSLIGFILFTGLLAGIYPAFYISGFKPISILKGKLIAINSFITPRNVLVVLQFTFAIALIICTMIITQQIKYAQARNLGYDNDHLVNIFIQGEMDNHFTLIKNDLLNSGAAIAVAKVQSPLTTSWSSGIDLGWQGRDPNVKIQINRYSEEGDLVKTAGMQLIAGRDIDLKQFPTDSTACLINESALKLMQFKKPIGELIFDDPTSWHVVGVIRDFVQESPYQPVKPMIIKGPKDWMGVILIRLNHQHTPSQNLAAIEKIFKQYNSAYPFEYTFTDQEYATKFSDEQVTGKLAFIFACLTIFISCLGLFGLAAYMARNRIKEIGVRKVLGASVLQITSLLSLDFIKWVIIAIVLGSPLAWWAMSAWLKDYDYRIKLDWRVFGLAGLLTLAIAWLTVCYESIKAALTNPIESLRADG